MKRGHLRKVEVKWYDNNTENRKYLRTITGYFHQFDISETEANAVIENEDGTLFFAQIRDMKFIS